MGEPERIAALLDKKIVGVPETLPPTPKQKAKANARS